MLRKWTKDFIRDRSKLPYPQSEFRVPPPYVDDEGLREEASKSWAMAPIRCRAAALHLNPRFGTQGLRGDRLG